MPNIPSRNCPQCNKIITYNCSSSYYGANRNNSTCIGCRNQNRKGAGNSFYGKKHSIESIEKRLQTIIKNNSYEIYKTKEFREKISKIGKDNPNHWMKHQSWREKLLEKYGPIEGQERVEEYIKIQRINSSGKNNPMYGKPTPKKAGNGWQGWYNNQFFRSLRELSYIINVLEKYNLQWQSAENIRIPYINYDGNERTYSPDYLVNNNKLVEIKPKRLHNTPLVKLKKEAAEKYCFENKLIYELIDVEIIDIDKLRELVINNKVILTEKTKRKLEKWKKES